MSAIEFFANTIAAFCFIYLFYRLATVLASTLIHHRRLARIEQILRQFAVVYRQLQSKPDARPLSNVLSATVARLAKSHPEAKQHCCAIRNITNLRRRSEHQRADIELDDWLQKQGKNYERQYQLADLATQIGMFWTVAGGILAFRNIGGSDDPFAAFPSLALAMLTTLGGLIVSIPVKLALNALETRLENLGQFAYQTCLELSRYSIASDQRVANRKDRGQRVDPPQQRNQRERKSKRARVTGSTAAPVRSENELAVAVSEEPLSFGEISGSANGHHEHPVLDNGRAKRGGDDA